MSGSRVCNFSFLWFLTCLSTGRVSGQGRPGQEVVTFLPQGDILYEISTVYTNQNTEAIITVVANKMIHNLYKIQLFQLCWIHQSLTHRGYFIKLDASFLVLRCAVDINTNVWFVWVTSLCPVLLSPHCPLARCGRKLRTRAALVCLWSLTPQLRPWPRGPEPWEYEQIRAYTRHTATTDNLSRNQRQETEWNSFFDWSTFLVTNI